MDDDTIYKHMKSAIRKKLLTNLKNDFQDLSEEQLLFFINNRLNENRQWNISNQMSLEEILNEIIPDTPQSIRWKREVIKNHPHDKQNTIYILIEYIINIFKNKTNIINSNMNTDFILTEIEFENIYDKIFRPFYTTENKNKMKQKKFRLKNKLCKGCINKSEDYEVILFRFIHNNI